MRKLIFTIIIIASIHFTGIAQSTAGDKQTLANEEIKKELVSKLNYSDENAGKIVVIENEFYTSVTAANNLPATSEVEKKAKRKVIHDAQVIRRSKLMELPLTARQMEDVIELSEANRRKHKL